MIRRPSMRRWLISTTALAGVLTVCTPVVHANPQGGTVAQGSAVISQPDAKTVQVNQSSDRAVIDWKSFSIAAGETTRFVQPSSSSMTLNRVTGDQVSQILGNLQANGRVVLVNPNGIVFGAGSKIDVAALVASTANIKNENFMAGNMKFDIPGKANAQIVNEGTITAADGGLVAIVSPYLRNSGIISARLGKVALAAANGVTLDLYGDNLILFQASDKIASLIVGADGQIVASLIENSGKIYADGGRVLMSTNAAKGVVDNAINTTGLISARAVEQQGGEIVLKGEDAGIVQVSGSLDASGKEAGQKGGTVNVLGEKVGLLGNASVDVSGDAGGGTALIGGDYQGKGSVRNAQVAYMGQDATINASALSTGNGGKAILWADGTTRSYGRIFAQGGTNGGDGGFVETSGKGFLDQTGTVNTLAPKGKTGTWLLDPMDIFVANNGGQTLDGTNSSLFADNSGGTSTIDPSVINSATSNVTLQASRDAYVVNAINMTNAGKALTIEAGRDLRVNANINTNNGDIYLLAGYDAASGQGGVKQGVLNINGATVYSGSGQIVVSGKDPGGIVDPTSNGFGGIVYQNGGKFQNSSGYVDVWTADTPDLSNNTVPAGWSLTKGSVNNGYGIVGGVLSAWPTDNAGDLGKTGAPPSSVREIRASWDGNMAFTTWGQSTGFMFMIGGIQYWVSAGYSANRWSGPLVGQSGSAIMIATIPDSGTSWTHLNSTNLGTIYGTYHQEAFVSNGSVRYRGYDNANPGAYLWDFTVNDAAIVPTSISAFKFRSYTTTDTTTNLSNPRVTYRSAVTASSGGSGSNGGVSSGTSSSTSTTSVPNNVLNGPDLSRNGGINPRGRNSEGEGGKGSGTQPIVLTPQKIAEFNRMLDAAGNRPAGVIDTLKTIFYGDPGEITEALRDKLFSATTNAASSAKVELSDAIIAAEDAYRADRTLRFTGLTMKEYVAGATAAERARVNHLSGLAREFGEAAQIGKVVKIGGGLLTLVDIATKEQEAFNALKSGNYLDLADNAGQTALNAASLIAVANPAVAAGALVNALLQAAIYAPSRAFMEGASNSIQAIGDMNVKVARQLGEVMKSELPPETKAEFIKSIITHEQNAVASIVRSINEDGTKLGSQIFDAGTWIVTLGQAPLPGATLMQAVTSAQNNVDQVGKNYIEKFNMEYPQYAIKYTTT
ncbi:heme utilization/adhesion protein [Paramagnetospirillum caucaseum]|uniref:Heme utilization/adhesion protein n=1 Tax=Paramagnetospirillum caucaseum TaxID=1244869 RepID=M2ZP21_9PROT|nr:filamentous hemagglutinin N-terminal domain-containing protein [Paramagnetospirillum caucaseum]EME69057.1 heme utilization/adhesion protein [Paramagnetospirillum caucaseum]